MLPFILLCGLRYNVGVDYSYTYTYLYDLVAQGLSYTQVNAIRNCEIGFYWLIRFIQAMGGGYVYLFTITSAVIISLFWIGFYQQSDNLCMSITLFICAESFFVSLSYVRQFMARAVVFYGIKYLTEKGMKNVLKYLRCVALACTFHTSAILMIGLIAAKYIRIHPGVLTTAIIIISSFKYTLEKPLEWLLRKTKYHYAIGTPFQSPVRFYMTRPIAYSILFTLAWIFYKKCRHDKNYNLILNTLAMLILITVNFDVMPQLDRVTWYYEILVMLCTPYLIKQIENRWLKKIVTIGLITMYAVFTYHNVVVYLAHGAVPYRFVLAPSMVIY
ncbi:MAG: EpsG family protein [Oscillospiraceae bacterium]|nr:EpsG family protein [Oscillospiraceae bacterium]